MPNRYVRLIYDSHLAYEAHAQYDGKIAVPVCDPLGRVIEYDQYVAADGTKYDLHAPWARSVLTDTGTGMPPIKYIENTGPAQDGQSVFGFYLQPRMVRMTIRQCAESRNALYGLQRDLINALRPNRSAPTRFGTLKKYLPNGDVMCLDCLVHDGLTFPGRDITVWDEYALNDTITFMAPYPIYYLEGLNTWEFSDVVAQLTFPATFPISFGALDVALRVIYDGDWPSYPTINVLGPITGLTVINNSTGERLSLHTTVPAGQSVTIDLAYNVKTATQSDGTDLTPYLIGDVERWHLAPDPEVTLGYNIIKVAGTNTLATTVVTLKYHDCYIGLRAKVH